MALAGNDLVHYWHLCNQRSKVAEPCTQGAFAKSELKFDFNMERKMSQSHKKIYDVYLNINDFGVFGTGAYLAH